VFLAVSSQWGSAYPHRVAELIGFGLWSKSAISALGVGLSDFDPP